MMMTREEHIEECRKVFNHIGILYDHQIVRCIGFSEDEDDYYWITVSEGRTTHASKVGGFVSLKDLNYPGYEYLDKQMDKLWGAPREKEFICKHLDTIYLVNTGE